MERLMRIAYCGGTFDLLHPGHIRFFKWVRSNFDFVIVALNTDEFVKKYKGEYPTQTSSERREMLEACRYVDKVIDNFSGADSKPCILTTDATHIVNGSDYTKETIMKQMQLTQDFLTENGLEVVLCTIPKVLSTTELKNRIRK